MDTLHNRAPAAQAEAASLFQRKKRGTKLQFMVGLGGTTVDEAHGYIAWDAVPSNIVIEFRGQYTFCSLVRPTVGGAA